MKTSKLFRQLGFFIIITTMGPVDAAQKPIFISLGSWCIPAFFMRNYGLREAPFPFDWIMSGSVENLCSILQSNFSNFLRRENLTSSQTAIYDHGSQCTFNHDFPVMGSGNYAIVPNYLDYYPTVKKRYNNHIQRFRDAAQSNRHVIFIRLDTDSTKQKAQQLRDCIASLYPTLDFDILYIGFIDDFKKPWHLDRVANVYIEGRTIESGIDYNAPSWRIVRSTVEYLAGMTIEQMSQPLGHGEDEMFT